MASYTTLQTTPAAAFHVPSPTTGILDPVDKVMCSIDIACQEGREYWV
jgi:hypothetical protein